MLPEKPTTHSDSRITNLIPDWLRPDWATVIESVMNRRDEVTDEIEKHEDVSDDAAKKVTGPLSR